MHFSSLLFVILNWTHLHYIIFNMSDWIGDLGVKLEYILLMIPLFNVTWRNTHKQIRLTDITHAWEIHTDAQKVT